MKFSTIVLLVATSLFMACSQSGGGNKQSTVKNRDSQGRINNNKVVGPQARQPLVRGQGQTLVRASDKVTVGEGSLIRSTETRVLEKDIAPEDIQVVASANTQVVASAVGATVVQAQAERLQIATVASPRQEYFATPILTGAADEHRFLYTDAKNDSVMLNLVNLMRAQDEKLRESSIDMALRLRDVKAVANIYERTTRVSLVFENNGQNVEVEFTGVLGADRRSRLIQVDSGKSLGFKFQGELTCIDGDGQSCQNTVLMIEQVADLGVCKRIYVVHRWGDVHVNMSDNEYAFYDVLPNKSHSLFMEYLSNTLLYKKQLLGEQMSPMDKEGKISPMPRARSIGLRTWSAAFGMAKFEVTFTAEMYAEAQPFGDQLILTGPLVSSQAGSQVSRQIDVEGRESAYSNVDDQDRRFSRMISRAYVTGNDGRGHIGLRLEYTGGPGAHSDLELTTLLKDVVETQALIVLPKK